MFAAMYAKRRDKIAAEASGAGARFFAYEESGGTSAGALVTHALRAKLPFVDKAVDGVQVFGFETQGVRHLYVQPWSGVETLPGEHHAWLHGSLRSPLAYARGLVPGYRWVAGGDEALTSWLATQGGVHACASACATKWRSGQGTRIDCTVQLRSLGDGRSHLVQHAGHHGGLLGEEVGVRTFLELGRAFAAVLPRAAEPAATFLHPVAYTEVFHRCLLGADAPPPAAAARDHSATLLAVGQPYVSETFFVASPGRSSLPSEIEQNVRALVLPAHERGAPLVAVLDLTALGSGKDAVAITPTYLYMRSMGETLGFALDDVASVEPPKGLLVKTVRVTLRSGRALKVQAGSDAQALFSVLAAVAST